MMITDMSLIKDIFYELTGFIKHITKKHRHGKPIKLFKCFAFNAIG